MSNSTHSQFELFSGKAKEDGGVKSSKFSFGEMTLSIENMVVGSILLVMALVVAFSFGVEKGKTAVLQKNFDQEIKFADSGKSDIIVKTKSVEKEFPVEEKIEVFPVDVPEIQQVEQEVEAPVVNSIPDNAYTIQVASFKTEEYARKEALLLKDKGFEIFVVSKGNYSIVCVGKFAQMDEAKKFASKLKGRYNDYLIRRM